MSSVDFPPSAAGTPPPAAPRATLQQAAEWFALLRSGDATEQDNANWRAWLDRHGDHREAWRHVETISRRFEPVHATHTHQTAVAALQAIRSGTPRRRQALRSMAALGGAGLVGWLAWRNAGLADSVAAWSADFKTATGEIREITLADRSRVWLNTASGLNVDLQPGLRRLQLVAGEVLIQTAGDASRPFVVDTSHGRLTALGTRFTVRKEADASFVGVYEGAVQVRATGSGATRIIATGEQMRFSSSDLYPTERAEPAREAWTRGVLLAEDIPLKDLVRELSRYYGGHLGVADAVAHLRVIGAYPLRDPDRVLAMLEEVLPVRARRTLPWWISIEPRHPAT